MVLVLLVVFGLQLLMVERSPKQELTYSTFLEQLETGNIQKVTKTGSSISGRLTQSQALPIKDGSTQDVQQFTTVLPFEDPDLIDKLREANPQVEIVAEDEGMNWWGALLSYLPFVLLIGIWLFFLRQMQSGGNRAFSFGKSKAKLVNADRPKVTFADVAGAEEAKTDLEELIEFLRAPKKFQKLGGKIPKGALMIGPPGTGKTLLAKAVAGEASVPFFAMSGSDFVEMFVGVGASRVRDLFEQGKKNAPCIVFIDEIDAVGRQRGAGLGGGHDEREQTLNQLLVEMDGFETNEGVIIIAATNRPDVLDPALLRPGRFDRQINVDLPDLIGREGILKVHLRNISMADEVDPKALAAGTPGMSGADLANLVNEGALLAARRNHQEVSMLDLEDAKERVMIGPERRAKVMPIHERERTAYHESGHAIVAACIEGYDPVHKVTIIPRGQALGLTFTLPIEDRYQITRDDAEARISVALGGRASEAIIYPQVGAGASNDIRTASAYARRMVTSWGMSDRLGPIDFGSDEAPVFMGRDLNTRPKYSQKTAVTIDEEVHRIISDQYARAESILKDHQEQLETMAMALLERETLDGEDVRLILDGEELAPLAPAPEPQRAAASLSDDEEEDEGGDEDAEGAGPVPGEVPPPQPS
jgi:cell division protease FtsH